MNTAATLECHCRRTRHHCGTLANYQYHGCRCLLCRVANSETRAARRRGEKPPSSTLQPVTGSARRLRALVAIGHSHAALAARLGVDRRQVAFFTAETFPSITNVNAERIAALYDELWDVIPHGHGPNLARRYAEACGWPPPLAWDDDEIDDPNAKPHLPRGPQPWELKPCGTLAAARRHYRRGEPLCVSCRRAVSRANGSDGHRVAS